MDIEVVPFQELFLELVIDFSDLYLKSLGLLYLSVKIVVTLIFVLVEFLNI